MARHHRMCRSDSRLVNCQCVNPIKLLSPERKIGNIVRKQTGWISEDYWFSISSTDCLPLLRHANNVNHFRCGVNFRVLIGAREEVGGGGEDFYYANRRPSPSAHCLRSLLASSFLPLFDIPLTQSSHFPLGEDNQRRMVVLCRRA